MRLTVRITAVMLAVVAVVATVTGASATVSAPHVNRTPYHSVNRMHVTQWHWQDGQTTLTDTAWTCDAAWQCVATDQTVTVWQDAQRKHN